MRHTLGVALAAATICIMCIGSAVADQVHYAGGPLQESGLCWTNSSFPGLNDQGFGYWHECQRPWHPVHRRHKD